MLEKWETTVHGEVGVDAKRGIERQSNITFGHFLAENGLVIDHELEEAIKLTDYHGPTVGFQCTSIGLGIQEAFRPEVQFRIRERDILVGFDRVGPEYLMALYALLKFDYPSSANGMDHPLIGKRVPDSNNGFYIVSVGKVPVVVRDMRRYYEQLGDVKLEELFIALQTFGRIKDSIKSVREIPSREIIRTEKLLRKDLVSRLCEATGRSLESWRG